MWAPSLQYMFNLKLANNYNELQQCGVSEKGAVGCAPCRTLQRSETLL